ncbi:MAG TPA: DUF1841 family protein [Accumulibacter sp.]|nr:DUF1841 family protein [Accumulibacter sp.]HMW18204.1 DUF1841 family protein [Accumulibacter sp.]HMX22330.1 DUF1841 family protein [Accumulibacter sp.]HMY05566.1 DUF1841 family protein [Accumulibacter sp.]HNC18320.1 DUF1841 family protein [Accumulibacter sp.]
MFNPSREQVRQFFCESWRKYRQRGILEGAEATAADLIAEHPEYHPLLEDPEQALSQEFTPENGQMNPFLHLSLHLAIAEQISIDQPPGIRKAYQTLRQRLDVHDAEHALIECLGEALWYAQRQGGAIDQPAYLESIRRRAGG